MEETLASVQLITILDPLITMRLQIIIMLHLTITDLLKEHRLFMQLLVNIKEIMLCLLYMLQIINLLNISKIISINSSKAVQFILQMLETKTKIHMEISIK